MRLATITDKDNNNVYFDARDIRRENINKEYIDVDLYRDGSLFEPDKGNATTVKTMVGVRLLSFDSSIVMLNSVEKKCLESL